MISKSNALYIQSTEESTWTVTHNLGYRGVLLNVYNLDNEIIYPDNIQLTDKNSLTLSFNTPVSGYVSVLSVGSPIFSDILSDSKFVLSEGNILDYKYSLIPTEVWDSNDYAYIRIDIPKEYEIEINEMGLLDNTDKILFSSICDTLYKSNKTTMSIFYKISKGAL
jgi:hypothetical protein